MKNTLDTYLIEENSFIREGLKALLKKNNFSLIVELENIEEINKIDKENNRGECGLIILSSSNIPTKTLSKKLEDLRSNFKHARIIILTKKLDMERIIKSYLGGADGIILKDICSDAFLNALNLVMLGEKVFPSGLEQLLLQEKSDSELNYIPKNDNNKGLSEREIEIITCLEKGEANKIIARRLNITESTVKVHIKAILRKLGLKNRTQAAIWAINNDIHPGSFYKSRV